MTRKVVRHGSQIGSFGAAKAMNKRALQLSALSKVCIYRSIVVVIRFENSLFLTIREYRRATSGKVFKLKQLL